MKNSFLSKLHKCPECLRKIICESLDNAVENCYDMTIASDVIAVDLQLNNAQCEDISIDDLIPHIKFWQQQHLEHKE